MSESLGFQKYSICRWASIFFSPWLSKGEWLHSPGGELVQAGIGEHVADQHHCPDHQRHVHAHAGGAWLDQLEVSGEGRMRTSAWGGPWSRPWSREAWKHPGNRGSIIGRLFYIFVSRSNHHLLTKHILGIRVECSIKWIFKVCIFFIGKSQKDCCLFFITSNPVSIFGGLHPDVTGDHLVFPFPESWALMQPRSFQNLTWNTERREDRETVETFWTFNERDILGTVWPKRGARNASHTISTPTQYIGAYNFLVGKSLWVVLSTY